MDKSHKKSYRKTAQGADGSTDDLEVKESAASIDPESIAGYEVEPESVREESGSGFESEQEDEPNREITNPYNPALIKIDTNVGSLSNIIARLKHKEFIIPEFQRKEVWNKQKKSLLIESLLVRIPLPVFYMDATREDGKWIVIDGMQRLSAIRDFVVDRTLKLSGLEYMRDLEGKGYDKIDRHFQRRIDESQVVVNIVQPGTPDSVKFAIFKRINTGGIALSSQEIRNAIYQGRASTLLRELAESDEFQKVTGTKYDNRMRARESILRFFAFAEEMEKYNELNEFLNEKMEKINDMDDIQIDNLRRNFYETLNCAYNAFGDAMGRKKTNPRSAINIALFESCMVTISKLTEKQRGNLLECKDRATAKLADLVANQEFNNAISVSTGNTGNVNKRFSMYKDMIDGIIEN